MQHRCQALHAGVTGRKAFAGRRVSAPATRVTRSRGQQICHAGHGFELPITSEPEQSLIEAPSQPYGLSGRQMAALGLTNPSISKALDEVRASTSKKQEACCGPEHVRIMNKLLLQESLRAKAWYSMDKVNENTRLVTRMGGGQRPQKRQDGKKPGTKPPDLPSLLLDARICFIGMPVSLQIVMQHLMCLHDVMSLHIFCPCTKPFCIAHAASFSC